MKYVRVLFILGICVLMAASTPPRQWVVSASSTISAGDKAKLLSKLRVWSANATLSEVQASSHWRYKGTKKRRFGFFWESDLSRDGQKLTDALVATFRSTLDDPSSVTITASYSPSFDSQAAGWTNIISQP